MTESGRKDQTSQENQKSQKNQKNQASQEEFPYEDIISLPHHVSRTHPHMAREDRAAQFSPFSALTGYDDAVSETARLTDAWHDLSDEEAFDLDQKLQVLQEKISDRPTVRITYFVPDERKDGGSYEEKTGQLRRIDTVMRVVEFTDKSAISIDRIVKVEMMESRER